MTKDWNDAAAGDARKAADEGWARAKGNGAQAARPRFPLIPFAALKPGGEQLYLVKRLIPRVGLTIVWGRPKCGKSFWTFDLMMHVALGCDYRGHRVKQGPVVYCAFEGASGFKLRAEAFRRQHSPPANVPFYLMGTPIDLVADHQALTVAIGAELDNQAPAAVVLDTLNRSLRGSESSDEDMAAYVRAADAIRDAFQCAVVIVHHCGHDGGRPRGHSALPGAEDAEIEVTRDAANNIIATVKWMKDGPEGDIIASRLESVMVGIDEDGEPITSCIVVPTEGDATEAAPKPIKIPKSAQITLRALDEAIGDAGEAAPASNHIPVGARVVSVDLWRQYTYKRSPSTSDKPRARQMAFQRATEALITSGAVGLWDDLAWHIR